MISLGWFENINQINQFAYQFNSDMRIDANLLSGSVIFAEGNNFVYGNSTNFTTELQVNDYILAEFLIRKVLQIQDNYVLYVDTTFEFGISTNGKCYKVLNFKDAIKFLNLLRRSYEILVNLTEYSLKYREANYKLRMIQYLYANYLMKNIDFENANIYESLSIGDYSAKFKNKAIIPDYIKNLLNDYIKFEFLGLIQSDKNET